jgi:hypothetical protein
MTSRGALLLLKMTIFRFRTAFPTQAKKARLKIKKESPKLTGDFRKLSTPTLDSETRTPWKV